ncbi:thiol-disulfide oxidoreductase [Candidatus Caldarchaeum subterraneum]|uniref:Thiol-disulfide oxidoreductase n=1 Tax=Caldiarchaeum subterraneum TaxID=311458 RepID=E6N3Q1_CALS0|nr:thiol-disulfide oxidoreductase [Candidatus Caldarchaeum subterraneum]BAJ49978.1 thiol-disulfide oxidoreductase [Candidatus Caldarchaeum subterraneum]
MPSKKVKKKRNLSTYLAVLPAALLVVFIAYLIVTPPSQSISTISTTGQTNTVKTGDIATPFSLDLIDETGLKNEKVSFRPDSGQIYFIDFIHEWCVHCRNMAPIVERLHQTYAEKGVVFITVAGGYNTDAQKTAQFIKNYRVTWPVGFDPQLEIFRQYGVRGTPTYVIVNKNGIIAAKLEGEQPYEALARELDRLLG